MKSVEEYEEWVDCVLRECLHNNTEVNHDISQTYQCCYTYLLIVII